jgi:hypothetical protein
MRRHPAAAGTLGIVLLALVAGCGGPVDGLFAFRLKR